MAEAGGVRIGDAERQAVVDLLRRHTGAGRLTLDEFAERAGEVYAAVTRDDLDAVLADLPQGVRPTAAPEPEPEAAHPAPAELPSATTPPGPDARPSARRGGTPRRRFVAIMSGSEAKGAWRAPEHITAFAFWGGVDIDLRNALIESPVVEIEAWSIMGGVTVTVPPGIPVDVDGFILMGGITNKVRGDEPLIPGAPLIRVKARGMWGGVTVRNPSRRRAARQARHDLRHQRHALRHEVRDARRRAGVDPRALAEEALDIARSAIDRALPPPTRDDRIPGMPRDQREPVARPDSAARSDRSANARQNAANQDANARQNAASQGAHRPGPAPPPTAPSPPTPPATPPLPGTPAAPAAPAGPASSASPAPAPAPVDPVVPSGPKIPTGTLTIMVSDIAGSTQMAERLGDQSWLAVLQEHNVIVRQHVSDHGGTEVKAQGDGFLVVFPSARSAVLAAIAIQRAMAKYDHDHLEGHPVAVRVGLHTGEVVAVEGDVFGQNVVVASRIAATADPGEIFVSGLTHDLTSSASDLGFEPGKDVDLKGMSQPWRVHRVIWS